MQFRVETYHFYQKKPNPRDRDCAAWFVFNLQIKRAVGMLLIGLAREKINFLSVDEYNRSSTGNPQREIIKRLVPFRESGRLTPAVSDVTRVGLRNICEPFGDRGVNAYKFVTGQIATATPLEDALDHQRSTKEAAKREFYEREQASRLF